MAGQAVRQRKAPVQDRAKATCARICTTTLKLLVTEGEAALNTNRIAREAGISIGTLYQYFPSKEAILTRLVHDHRRAMLEALRASDATLPDTLPEAMLALLSGFGTAYLAGPETAQHLDAVERHLPPDEAIAAMQREIAAIPVACLSEHMVRDPERVAADLMEIARALAIVAGQSGDCDTGTLSTRLDPVLRAYLDALTG